MIMKFLTILLLPFFCGTPFGTRTVPVKLTSLAEVKRKHSFSWDDYGGSFILHRNPRSPYGHVMLSYRKEGILAQDNSDETIHRRPSHNGNRHEKRNAKGEELPAGKEHPAFEDSAANNTSLYDGGEPGFSNITGRLLKTCDPGFWLCGDRRKCIPETEICSGKDDCDDASDEAIRICGCLTNEFLCAAEEKCIDIHRRCDAYEDCFGGEDEKECETYKCPESHLQCDNGTCISLDLACDFVNDCVDGKDELNCPIYSCYVGDFTCDNRQCLQPGRVCDSVPDCVDASDEKNCSESDFVSCGTGEKIHRAFWCDDVVHCEDNHADEIICGDECSATQYRCRSNRCIYKGNVCDAQCDCVDCDDEENCDTYDNSTGIPICHLGKAVTCIIPHRSRTEDRCVSAEYICDGINHCRNGKSLSDEYQCMTNGSECDGFLCRDSRCLDKGLNARCDFRPDCLHGEDELNCDFEECSENQWRCDGGQCVSLADRCDMKIDCRDKSDEINCNMSCSVDQWKCGSGQCIPKEFRCDHFVDCLDKSDERNCDHPPAACNTTQFACKTIPQCVPFEHRCVDVTDVRNHGCADGSHIWGCEDEQCSPQSDLLKCHRGPCVPLYVQCNSKFDCLQSATDEENCTFACDSDFICSCFHLTANCSSLKLTKFPDIEKNINIYILANNSLYKTLHKEPVVNRPQIIHLDLARNKLKFLRNGTFKHLWRLKELNLKDNNLTYLREGTFTGLHNLTNLQLTGNQIHSLGPFAFSGLLTILNLDLSHQRLTHIAPKAFHGLKNLKALFLQNNNITTIDEKTFFGLHNLKKLNLKENPLSNVSKDTFAVLPNLNTLITDEWHWCCLAPQVETCLPRGDQFSSCEDLMSNIVLRVFIWILGLTAFVGNSFVILWRILYSSGNKMHSFLIVNLGIGDLLMGVYLLIVAAVDLNFRGNYAVHAKEWRSSTLCQIAGFISTFSSELSVFTLTVITVDRLMVIRYPFGLRGLSRGLIPLVMAGVWLAVAFFSALPLAPIPYFNNFYGRSGVCLALHITNEKPSGWEYSVFIFLVINMINFAVIAVSYGLMFSMAQQTRLAVRKRPDTQGEGTMATRMTLIVATDAACWLPIIFLGIISLCGVSVPPKVFSWIAVFVLPVNSAVNPVLYTLSTAPVRTRMRTVKDFVSFRGSRTMSTSLKNRMITDASEVPNLAETEVRLIKSRPSVRVYTPVRQETPLESGGGPDISNNSNWNSKAALRTAESNGKRENHSVPENEESAEESETSEPRVKNRSVGVDHDISEVIPLKDLNKPLPVHRINYRKFKSRKSVTGHLYD
ncbi:G-protein coupled receptor GRL101-like isoform X2 [Macrobrachium nipponense]|uniref:G-protein coupled receptor GRL101-like isoform X2 n=1 Tax=Macrobrachium nipponense TaxID=159736 RepID=UPI0030C87666